MINVKNIEKSYGSHVIIDNVSFNVKDSESVALIGFSGSGKSTMLKMIAGLELYQSGAIHIPTECSIGMSFQYSALFDFLNVRDNIAFPLEIGDGLPELTKFEINQRVTETLKLVGLPGTERMMPSELSGGMKKRISFARTIINKPNVLLFDEPTAGLDPMASTVIEDLIVTLRQKTHASSIVVTHQQSTIKRTADRVLMLHEGKIVWEGTPDELFDPNNLNLYARQFASGSTEGPMKLKI